MNLGATLGAGLTQSYSNSASSYANSSGAENYSQNMSEGSSSGWSMSGTNAAAAREWSAEQAALAWARDKEAMYEQMAYNTMEAEKQRKWQENMANTIYTRSVANMKKAGINPILAANMGLSGASVGSGATASLGGIPSAPLAQSFMDSWSQSANSSHSRANGFSNGSSWGEGYGSGWSSSEGGIATALSALGNMADSALSMLSSAAGVENAQDFAEQVFGSEGKGLKNNTFQNNLKKGAQEIAKDIKNIFGDWFTEKNEHFKSEFGLNKGGGHSF